MELGNIPKVFWYSVSFSIVVSTIGLLVIANKSASISIEIADAKINLISAIDKTMEIRNELQRVSPPEEHVSNGENQLETFTPSESTKFVRSDLEQIEIKLKDLRESLVIQK